VAPDPGGAYRIDVTNQSSYQTPSFALSTRATTVSSTANTGALGNSGTASYPVTSAGTGTLEADVDWAQGQTSQSQTFTGSFASGASPSTYPVSVTSTQIPITGSLDWATYGKNHYENGSVAALGTSWQYVSVQGPGTIDASINWVNSTSGSLTSSTHLSETLYDPNGNQVATQTAGTQYEYMSYQVPQGGPTGTYSIKIVSKDLAANYWVAGVTPTYADLNLELLNPSNQVVASDLSTTTRPAAISYSPSSTGTYTFRVSTAGSPTPSYTLSTTYPVLAYANVVAKLYNASNNLLATSSGRPGVLSYPSMASGSYHVDVVNLSANIPVPSYTVNIRPPTQRTPDFDLQLLDASGNVVAQPADHSIRPEVLTYANAPAGTYTLKVIARQYGGSFSLDYSLPVTEVQSTAYDPAGRQLSQTDPSGTTGFVYDTADRVTQQTLPDSTTRGFTYFADGQIKTLTDPTGTQTFAYDRVGQLSSAIDQSAVTTSYGYDAAGNQTSLTRGSSTVSSGYDAVGQLTSRTAAGGTASFSYDGGGNLTQVTAAAGDTDMHELNPASQITDVEYHASPSGPTLLDMGFQYDAQGNRQNRLVYDQNDNKTPVANFGYNDLGQLTNENYQVGGVTKSVTYGFDAQGNRTSVTSSAGTTSYSYNAAGQLLQRTDPTGATTGYAYDQRGNLTKSVSAAGAATYSWTPDNRLSQVALPGKPIVSFTYDANGLRRTKTVGSTTTTYSYDQGNLASESTPGVGTTSYTYDGSGAPLTITVPSGATYTYHYTESGSVAQLTDTSHNVVASYTYDSWGNVVDSSGNQGVLDSNPVLYRGMFGVRFDRETGLYLMSARYYDAFIARFLTEDPASSDPASSPYTYAANNPVMLLDSTGLYACGDPDCRSNALYSKHTGASKLLRLPWSSNRKRGIHLCLKGCGNFFHEAGHKHMDEHAIDFGLHNEAVLAVTAGRVVCAGWGDSRGCKTKFTPSYDQWTGVNGYGFRIIVHNRDGSDSLYAHLSRAASGIKDGSWVTQGMIIAMSGDSCQTGETCRSGHSGQYHLHFSMRTGMKSKVPAPMSTRNHRVIMNEAAWEHAYHSSWYLFSDQSR
jgi:RHS repeat-associated protein